MQQTNTADALILNKIFMFVCIVCTCIGATV